MDDKKNIDYAVKLLKRIKKEGKKPTDVDEWKNIELVIKLQAIKIVERGG